MFTAIRAEVRDYYLFSFKQRVLPIFWVGLAFLAPIALCYAIIGIVNALPVSHTFAQVGTIFSLLLGLPCEFFAILGLIILGIAGLVFVWTVLFRIGILIVDLF